MEPLSFKNLHDCHDEVAAGNGRRHPGDRASDARVDPRYQRPHLRLIGRSRARCGLSPTSIESWSETALNSWSKRTTRSPAAEEQQGGGSDGSQQQVAVLRDGDFFGEIA